MARARNIKPGFFSNDDLVELPFEARLLFIGLWTIADRAGRLLDRPKKIKMDIFPGDNVDVEACLVSLAQSGFIIRYESLGVRAIQVSNWSKHQNPHVKEAASTIPYQGQSDASTMQAPCKDSEGMGCAEEIPERAGLIPDSLNLIPDTGYPLPDSGFSDPIEKQQPAAAVAPPAKKARKVDAPNPLNLDTWLAYKSAYAERYGVAPVQNAKSNSIIKQVVQALGAEAEHVAAFYVRHNDRNYVVKMHQLNLLLADHAKLRTEWATNTSMTQEKARQVDRTATNLDAFGPLIAAARARETEGEK